jgi:hypothetical protein
MNHLLRFSLFEEVNPKDIAFIESISDYFTTAFEFEIETEDKTNIKIDFSILYDDDVVTDMIDIVRLEMDLKRKKEKDLVENIIYSVIDATEEGIITNDMLFDIFNPENFETDRDAEIASFTKSILISHISGEDLSYMKKQAKKYLPNFTKKWDRKLDYVEDATLERGIEIKPKKYLTSLSDGIQMIEDFYSDLSNQDYWNFSTRTGLHINIGTNRKDIEWNPIKGLLMMNDFNEEGESTPYVFKDMTWRFNNNFCGSLMSAIKKMDRESIDELKKSIDLNDIKSAEVILNGFLVDRLKEWGHKNFGFNLTKLDLNYVEFRYAGGEISKDVLIEKLKYFSFVVYTMTNPEYKRKEYLKKLYKFIDNL